MILAATGMKREAAIIARAGRVPVISGGDAGRLRALLEAQAANARAIVSIGIAGALSPDLRVGDVVVGSEVTQIPLRDKLGEEFGWVAYLLAALPGARQGVVCGSDTMVITAAAKARLYAACRATSTLIIDMESHVAAEVARANNLPFVFIRVISDRADQDLPPAVTCGIKPDGSMAILPVLTALVKNPRQLPALIRTARDTDRAMRALLGACDVLARGGIGLPDRF